MGANVSVVFPDFPPDECGDCDTSYFLEGPEWEWFCHCHEDPQPVKKAPRVLGEDERFGPREYRARRCACCEFVADEPANHCEECFVFWEEDPASYPTHAEIEAKERQDAEGGHDKGCYLGNHCGMCCGCSRVRRPAAVQSSQ